MEIRVPYLPTTLMSDWLGHLYFLVGEPINGDLGINYLDMFPSHLLFIRR